jgi:hypothetical protein
VSSVVSAGITDIEEATFSTQSARKASTIVVKMRGNADTTIHDRLKVFLDDVHRAAEKLHFSEAVFDVEELYFMNSSCMSLILRMINGMLESPQSKKYVIRFRSNRNLRWQRKSLEAIRSYAPDVVVVE